MSTNMKTKSIVKRIILSFDKALDASAKQNFNRDVRNGKICESHWNKLANSYFCEARVLLLRDKENSRPEYPDIEHYCLS